MITHAEKIQRLISEAGLTESVIARQLEVSQATVNRIKHGRQKRVSYEIGRAIDVMYDDYFSHRENA